MTSKTFRAYWSIERQAEYVAAIDQGDVAYTFCPLLYGWDMEHTEDAPGDYITFRTDDTTFEIIPGAGGPMDVCDSVEYDGDFEAYGVALAERTAAVLAVQMSGPWDISSAYAGRFVVDLEAEAWPPFWRRTIAVSGDPYFMSDYPAPWSLERHWRAYVRSHVTEITGLTSGQWGDLEPEEQEDLFESTFLSRSRAVYTALFGAVRTALPNAIISDWGWPQRAYYDLRPDISVPRRNDLIRSNTLHIPWMARHWDFLTPWMYPLTRAVSPGSSFGPKDELEADWMTNYGRVCEEVRRVKALCGGLPVNCCVGPFFEVREPSPLYELPLNALTARLQVEICRTHGFDGVIMWGAINPPSGTPDPSAYAAARRAAMQEGLDVMQPLIKAYMDTLDNTRVATNSPVAIGTIG